jgi:hypothetical protein
VAELMAFTGLELAPFEGGVGRGARLYLRPQPFSGSGVDPRPGGITEYVNVTLTCLVFTSSAPGGQFNTTFGAAVISGEYIACQSHPINLHSLHVYWRSLGRLTDAANGAVST